MEKGTCCGTDKFKGTWDYCSNFSFDEKDSNEISWPPRHYTCSFCRKNFKSAQALGGHMNVHRRDRAMLRQAPSWAVQYPNPNPNLVSPSSISSPSATLPPYNHFILNSWISPSLTSLTSPSSASTYTEKTVMVMGHPHKPSIPRCRDKRKLSKVLLEDFTQEDEYKVVNNGQIAESDLEIELVRNKKEDLDLELRLGYS